MTTPDGSLVAMVHCNNCTSDLNAWVNLFREFQETMGQKVDMNELYGNALQGRRSRAMRTAADSWRTVTSPASM